MIPGFEPSPESYALAVEALGRVVAVMNEAGITDHGDIDCMVAMVAGLIEAQLSNEPGGDRWLRHLDRMVDLLADNANERTPPMSNETAITQRPRKPASSPRPSSRSSPPWPPR